MIEYLNPEKALCGLVYTCLLSVNRALRITSKLDYFFNHRHYMYIVSKQLVRGNITAVTERVSVLLVSQFFHNCP